MKTELINKIVLNEENVLLLILASGGEASYQYVYREGAGVNWDSNLKGFKSTPLNEWSVIDWFYHIRETVKAGLDVDLKLDNFPTWENIPESEQARIINAL